MFISGHRLNNDLKILVENIESTKSEELLKKPSSTLETINKINELKSKINDHKFISDIIDSDTEEYIKILKTKIETKNTVSDPYLELIKEKIDIRNEKIKKINENIRILLGD